MTEPAPKLLKGQKMRALIAPDFTEAYKKCDVILTPPTPRPAFVGGDKSVEPVGMYLNDVFSLRGEMAGLSRLSVPAGP